MNRSEIVIEIDKHLEYFFVPKWAEFCRRMEEYAAEIKRLSEKGAGARNKSFEIAKPLIDLGRRTTDDQKRLKRAIHATQKALYPEGYVEVASADYDFVKVQYTGPCGKPPELVNPASWFFGLAAPRTKDDEVLHDAVVLIVAHDAYYRDRNKLLLLYKPGTYPAGGLFQADVFMEALTARLRQSESDAEVQAAWEGVKDSLGMPNTGRHKPNDGDDRGSRRHYPRAMTHEEIATPEDWKEYLQKVADKARALVMDPSSLSAFQEAIRPWAQQYEKHEADVQRWIAAGKGTRTDVLRLAAIKVPKRGQTVARLEVTPHPADTLRLDKNRHFPALPPAEERTRDFAIIATICDNMTTHSPRITAGVWPEGLLAQAWMHLTWDTYAANWPEKGEIDSAFMAVERDLGADPRLSTQERAAETSEAAVPEPLDIARLMDESRHTSSLGTERKPAGKILRFDLATRPVEWLGDFANVLRKNAESLTYPEPTQNHGPEELDRLKLLHVLWGSVIREIHLLLREVKSQRDQVLRAAHSQGVQDILQESLVILSALDDEWETRDANCQNFLDQAELAGEDILCKSLDLELKQFRGYLNDGKVVFRLKEAAAALDVRHTFQVDAQGETNTPPSGPAKIRDQEPQPSGSSETPAGKPYTFGLNYRSVNWYGDPYTFRDSEAPLVAILAEAYEAGTPDVDAGAILGLSNDERKAKGKKESYAHRVRDLLRDNPAWGKMIQPGKGHGKKGTYHLQPPQVTP